MTMTDTLELQYEPFPLLHMPLAKYEFDQDTKLLEKLMIDTMRQNKGIGLAANQVNIPYQMFVMGNDFIEGFVKPTIFINPMILKVSEEKTLDKEGCLSFPGLWLNVERPKKLLLHTKTLIKNGMKLRLTDIWQNVFNMSLIISMAYVILIE